MIGKRIGEEKPVTVAAVKNMLTKREKDGELHYEQKLALEFATKFAKVSQKAAEEIVEQLLKLEIPRFKDTHAVKIVDLMPEDEEAVKALFAKETITLKKEQIQKVLEILGKHR